MPCYCFKCFDCDYTVEKTLPIEQCGERPVCPNCGVSTERDFVAEQADVPHHPGTWPLKSDALGVHPSQVNEAVEQSRKLGVPTEFTPDGRAVLTSQAHRKRYAEAVGFYDRNGGYGDPRKGMDSRRV